MIYLLLFYSPIRCSNRAIRLCVYLSTVEASSEGIHIYIALISVALLGVCQRGGLSSHMFYTCALLRLEYSHWVVYFYMVYSNTLVICLLFIISRFRTGNLPEVSSLFLRILFFLNFSAIFRGGYEVVSEYFQSFPHNLSSLSCMFSLGISTPVSDYSTV